MAPPAAPEKRGKKPLPERLREKLKEQAGPYAPARPSAPRLERAHQEDPHSVERRMLEDILNGCAETPQLPDFDSSPRGEASGDLVAQMAARLGKLEASTRRLRDDAEARESALAGLRAENARLRAGADDDAEALLEENEALRTRCREMESFLADYGLVWVGGAAPPPAEPVAPSTVDAGRVVDALIALNAKIAGDRPAIKVDGQRGRFERKEAERVAVYADGLLIGAGPFRAFERETAAAFVRDVLDGYFPSEFKDRHPDGVAIDVVDKRADRFGAEPFGGAGRASGRAPRTLHDGGDGAPRPVAAETFLRRLPTATVAADGRIVDVRDAIRKRISGGGTVPVALCDSPKAADAQDGVATLQVRADATRFVVKLPFEATVRDLRSAIDAERGPLAPDYEVRTAFPARAYADLDATLQAEGLVPTATIMLQKV